MFKRNPFGHILFIKTWLIRILGLLTHQRFKGFNKLKIEGSEILNKIPQKNVLFVSNHQTYFADVVAMFHVFNAGLSGRVDSIKNIGYLWKPKLNIYFVAAKETMKAGPLPRILAYAGSISIERTWRDKGKDINRQVKMSDISNIGVALDDGWVITFPQGTTKPFKPVRKGTAHLIKHFKPKVIPIVIDMLNVESSFDHHWKCYGEWSHAVDSYVHEGIMDWMGSREFNRLNEIVEPYSFIQELDLPKFLINATGDEFFVCIFII